MSMKRTSKRIVWAVLMLFLAANSGCAREEPGVEIPLNTIWGWEIPGTRDIKTLEPDHFGPAVRELPGQEQNELLYSSLTYLISEALYHQVEKKRPIGPGFAVQGTGRHALEAVKVMLEQEQLLIQTFSHGTEVSLFFFTRDSGHYVHLKDVRQLEQAVVISYRFVPHSDIGVTTKQLTKHFALIPLGKLAVGKYSVQILRSPMEKRYQKHGRPTSQELVEKLICKSFSFSVEPSSFESSNTSINIGVE